MSELLLTATTGREEGTRPSRRLRREGHVPAVVYGLGADPVAVSVPWPELRLALTTDAGLNALITLDIEGEKQLSIIKDLQRHPVRRDVLHVDFIRVGADAEVEVEIPVVLVGEAKNVTQKSGMVDHVMHALPVLAKVDAIPEKFEVDISDLEVGDSIRVDQLDLPAGVRPSGDPEAAIAVGVITRSTMEQMRMDRLAEEGVDEAAEGDEDAEGDVDADESSDGAD
jgi:large subunit ribosomal protein L25